MITNYNVVSDGDTIAIVMNDTRLNPSNTPVEHMACIDNFQNWVETAQPQNETVNVNIMADGTIFVKR